MGNFEINFDRPEPPGGVVEIRGGGPSRGVVAIVAGLLIVVVLVVALGRSRDKDVSEPPTTTTLFASTTTSVGASTTTSTTSPPETTTTIPAVQVFGPLLPDKTGATLVVARTDGRLVQVDVDSGTVTDLAPGQRPRNFYLLLVLKDGVVLSGGRSQSFVSAGEVTSLPFADEQALGTPDGIQVIGVSYTESAASVVSVIPGGERGPAIELPPQSDPVSMLPGAIVLQSRAGGVYRFDLADNSIRKIADGTFLAITGDRVASMRCDDALKCRIGVGPLGQRPQHQIDVPEPFGGYYGLGGNSLSPTRDLLAYVTNSERGFEVAVLDLDTGSVVMSADMATGPQGISLLWSPDGRWLFWVHAGYVVAWSPERGGDPIEFANLEAGAAEMIAAAYAA